MRSKFFFGIAAMLLLASCEESFEMETNLVIGNLRRYSLPQQRLSLQHALLCPGIQMVTVAIRFIGTLVML